VKADQYKQWLKDQELTNEKVAKLLGVTLRTIYGWQRKDYFPPHIELALKYIGLQNQKEE